MGLLGGGSLLFLLFIPVEGERSQTHPFLNILVSYSGSPLLMLLHNILEDTNQQLFDLSTQHLATSVLLSHLLELGIILKEESEIVVGDVDLQVGSIGPVFFGGLTTT